MVNPVSPFFALQEMGRLTKDGMIIYDLTQQEVAYINHPAASLTGLQEQSGLSDIESALQRIHPNEREVVQQQYREARQTTSPEFEFTILCEGTAVMVKCHVYRLPDALVMILRDITRTRQHEDYLLRYSAKKNTLLDTLAHQISGALSLMQHLSAEAGKLLPADAEVNVKTYLNLMEANCLHCIDIINDLMRHEYVESMDIVVRKTKVDVVQIVSIIHQELLQTYSARKITLHSDSDSIQVMTDNVKLLLVINNLTSNALKFSSAEALIFIAIRENDASAAVRVSDQGIGIPEALKPAIFKKQRGGGRAGLNGERSGGIGLSISKNLVELMGGRIWFDSEEGKGSTFYVSLPKD